MELQRQQEVNKFNQKLIGPPKPKREHVVSFFAIGEDRSVAFICFVTALTVNKHWNMSFSGMIGIVTIIDMFSVQAI